MTPAEARSLVKELGHHFTPLSPVDVEMWVEALTPRRRLVGKLALGSARARCVARPGLDEFLALADLEQEWLDQVEGVTTTEHVEVAAPETARSRLAEARAALGAS